MPYGCPCLGGHRLYEHRQYQVAGDREELEM